MKSQAGLGHCRRAEGQARINAAHSWQGAVQRENDGPALGSCIETLEPSAGPPSPVFAQHPLPRGAALDVRKPLQGRSRTCVAT